MRLGHQIIVTFFTFSAMLPLFFGRKGSVDDKQPNDIIMLHRPATSWEKEAFPLGNGSLGCMVFGGVGEECIQFNLDNLWSGDENLPENYEAPGMGTLAKPKRLGLLCR
jgi:hypothetical protein